MFMWVSNNYRQEPETTGDSPFSFTAQVTVGRKCSTVIVALSILIPVCKMKLDISPKRHWSQCCHLHEARAVLRECMHSVHQETIAKKTSTNNHNNNKDCINKIDSNNDDYDDDNDDGGDDGDDFYHPYHYQY